MPQEDGGQPISEVALRELSGHLVVQFAIAVPDWCHRCVEHALLSAINRPGGWPVTDAEVDAILGASETAGWAASDEVGARLWALLIPGSNAVTSADIIRVVQAAAAYPTNVLRQAHVPGAQRSRAAMRQAPGDVYQIVPHSFAALHPLLPDLVRQWEEVKTRR